MGITLAATVFVFSLIVFVHEAGHFITAKLTGMQVDEFAIGFGPKLYSRKYGETVYSLRIIPLGGFNKIAGMSDEEELNERSFLNKPVLSRLLVISAGALMNFLLAFLLLWGIVFSTGISSVLPDPIVGGIIKNSAAAEAGIEPGDRIISVGNKPVNRWIDIPEAIEAHQREVVPVVYERDGSRITVDTIPKTDEKTGRTLLGVMPSIQTKYVGVGEAAHFAVNRIVDLGTMMLTGLYRMVSGTEKAELAGPIGVAQLAGQAASVGFVNLLTFTAFLSLNLGILNLLPIPMLDGGYIILILLEGITRRKMPKKALYYIQMAGVIILGAMFIFALVQDISRF